MITDDERRIQREVLDLMRATESHYGSGPAGIGIAVNRVKPSPKVFWRFIEALTEWTVRP